MRRRARRIASLTAATGLLSAAVLANTNGAAAADDEVRFSTHDLTVAPYTAPRFGPELVSGQFSGKIVIAMSTKPLTGPAGDGAGIPAGFTAQRNGCEEVAGLVAVYVCDPGEMYPGVEVPRDVVDMTTLYWGFAYVPKGGDLAAGIEAARTAGARSADATHGTGTVVAKTLEHAALNTVDFDLPTLPAGGTVRQQLHFHANDRGQLVVYFFKAAGQEAGTPEAIRMGDLTPTPGASCKISSPDILSGAAGLACDLEPGEHTIEYELTGDANLQSWKIEASTLYDIYDIGNSSLPGGGYVNQTQIFSVQGAPVRPPYFLLARDAFGTLFQYYGTANAAAPFRPRVQVGSGWQIYNQITPLSPLQQNLEYSDGIKPSATTQGRGDLVARDASGTLWYYDRQFVPGKPYAPRVKVGTGWNIYNQLTGAGDLNRDGHMDLLARDKAGILWLYQGTGSLTGGRFKPRARIGGGWHIYNQITAGTDLTGDNKADLLARDSAGVLWLYKGTGNATAPYASRVKIGTGWNIYNQLAAAGDLTDDGKADFVARDKAGVLWLYKGTGNATAPYATRTKIGGGWQIYNILI